VSPIDPAVAADAMWIDVGDGRLSASVTGKGPPLLLVHGWAMDHRIFTPQTEVFGRSMRVITFDRRGFGKSEAPPALDKELDDIERLIDELANEPIHLLGMSQGGRLALRYAVTRPDRLRSLILQGAMVDGLSIEEDQDERIPLAAFIALVRRGKIDEVRRRWRRHPMMSIGDANGKNQALIDAMLETYEGEDLRGDQAEHFRIGEDIYAALTKLDLPTLVLTGANDTAVRRRHATTLVERIPGAREIVFGHSGHLCNLTEADAYNQAVLNFVSEQTRQQA
jgi:pimeloyl-ACP methyl ester carboxylesterase